MLIKIRIQIFKIIIFSFLYSLKAVRQNRQKSSNNNIHIYMYIFFFKYFFYYFFYLFIYFKAAYSL